MVPPSFVGYFIAAAGAAAALIGLLFVAISLRPETVIGPKASASGSALAESTFTGLLNAFFVSLLAAVPHSNVGVVAVVVATVSLFHTVRLHRRLVGPDAHRLMLLMSAIAFVSELADGVILVVRPHVTDCVNALCYVVAASFAVALARAWSLMQGRHIDGAASRVNPRAT